MGMDVITPKSFEKQVAFAVAGALNTAAFAVRAQLVKAVPVHFTERNTWTKRSFGVNKASRATPVAEVGSREKYVEDQAVGETRTSGAIPTRRIRRNPRTVVRKRSWPGAILDTARFFLADRRATRGPWGRQRPGLRAVVERRPGRRRRTVIAYYIPDSQDVKPRFPFEKIAVATAEDEFNRALPGALQRALEGAR